MWGIRKNGDRFRWFRIRIPFRYTGFVVKKKEGHMPIDIKELARKILDESKDVRDVLIKAKSGGLSGAKDCLPLIIKEVEDIGKIEGLKGAAKKALAIAILNAVIDIPFVPESLEGVMIGLAIDAVIASFNKWVGKDWINKIMK